MIVLMRPFVVDKLFYNIENLKKELVDYTHDKNFKECKTMGDIIQVVFDFVVRNYESVNTYIIR